MHERGALSFFSILEKDKNSPGALSVADEGIFYFVNRKFPVVTYESEHQHL
jgi:hypothetical protein